jgi:hypothetical protein
MKTDVFFTGDPSQVFGAVVQTVPVDVMNFAPIGRTVKGIRDETSDVTHQLLLPRSDPNSPTRTVLSSSPCLKDS